MANELNVNFIWDSLSDFWQLFEDRHIIEQLWRGYIHVVNDIYYQIYQIDLSKNIHTVPHQWISSWELFIFNEDTKSDAAPWKEGYDQIFKLPVGVRNVVRLTESPRETIILPKNTAMALDGTLILPNGDVRHLPDDIMTPEAIEVVEGNYFFPNGLAVKSITLESNIDYVVDEDRNLIAFNTQPYERMWSNVSIRDLTIIYDNFGVLLDYYKPDSYTYLREVQGLWYAFWNGSTINNIIKGITILSDLPFVRTEGVVERISVDPRTIKLGGQVFETSAYVNEILEVGDTITFIDSDAGVVVFNDSKNIRFGQETVELLSVWDSVEEKAPAKTFITISGDVYEYSGESAVTVSQGEIVDRFHPLTQSVKIYDYINRPNWWYEYIGDYTNPTSACALQGGIYFDMNLRFDQGTFDAYENDECVTPMFVPYFTFLVELDTLSWFKDVYERNTLLSFLEAIKPAYTNFMFQFAMEFSEDMVALDKDIYFQWEERPIDIPVDHYIFDMEGIHHRFDDGATFDLNENRDELYLSFYGDEFVSNVVIGRIFDDEAAPHFDIGALDEEPYIEDLRIEWRSNVTMERSKTLVRGETLIAYVTLFHDGEPLETEPANMLSDALFENGVREALTIEKGYDDGMYILKTDLDTWELPGREFYINIAAYNNDDPPLVIASFNETFYIANSATDLSRDRVLGWHPDPGAGGNIPSNPLPDPDELDNPVPVYIPGG